MVQHCSEYQRNYRSGNQGQDQNLQRADQLSRFVRVAQQVVWEAGLKLVCRWKCKGWSPSWIAIRIGCHGQKEDSVFKTGTCDSMGASSHACVICCVLWRALQVHSPKLSKYISLREVMWDMTMSHVGNTDDHGGVKEHDTSTLWTQIGQVDQVWMSKPGRSIRCGCPSQADDTVAPSIK